MVEEGKDCAQMGLLYELTCNSCKETVEEEGGGESRDPGGQRRENYIGMTRTSAHCRMQSHLQSQRAKSSSSPLWRHDRDRHQGEPQKYTARILRKERNLLPLCIMEALYIEKQATGTTLNDKNEHGRGQLIRIRANRE